MVAAVLAAVLVALPGLELQLRPPDLRSPHPAAFLAQDLAAGTAAGPAEHGWGGELAAGAAGAILGTAPAAMLFRAALTSCDSSHGKWEFICIDPGLALAASAVEVLFVPLAASLGVKWAGGHPDGNGWRAYGYSLGAHAVTLGLVLLAQGGPLGAAALLVGDLVLVPLAARAGWHHLPDAPAPGSAPGAISFRF